MFGYKEKFTNFVPGFDSETHGPGRFPVTCFSLWYVLKLERFTNVVVFAITIAFGLIR